MYLTNINFVTKTNVYPDANWKKKKNVVSRSIQRPAYVIATRRKLWR